MSQKQLILIDPRAYNYMKTAAVQNVEDALVELITNADDAYDKVEYSDKNNIKRKIDIEIYYPSEKNIKQQNYGSIIVRDNALGLTGERMQECFLQVGKFTSDDKSRGFFSRGAKDISSLGHVIFESIKDGMYSRVSIDNDSFGTTEVMNVEATEEIRKMLNIENNGLQVTIQLLEKVKISHPDVLCEALPKIVSLRSIFSDDNYEMKFISHQGDEITTQYLKYIFPKGDMIMEIKYEVPGYQDVIATMKLFKCKEQLERHHQKKYQEFGFFIKSEKVIHDIDSFDHEMKFDPDLQYFWGYIECDKINDLMRDFDNDKKNKKNPFPIIDPNRINGINKSHPFYRALIQLPMKRMKLILDEMDETEELESLNNIDISKLTDILKDLNIISTDFVPSDDHTLGLFSDPRGKLIRAIESERGKYVKVERNFFMNVFTFTGKGVDGDTYTTGDGQKVKNRSLEKTIERENELDIDSDEEQENEFGVVNDKQSLFREVEDEEVGDSKKIYVYDKNSIPEQAVNESNRYINAKKDSRFRILFKKDARRDYKFEIKRRINTITIKINIEHHLIRDYYVDENMDISDLSPEGLLILQQIMTEAFTRLLLQNEGSQSAELLQAGSGEELVEKFIVWKEKKEKIVEKLVYNVIRKLINDKK